MYVDINLGLVKIYFLKLAGILWICIILLFFLCDTLKAQTSSSVPPTLGEVINTSSTIFIAELPDFTNANILSKKVKYIKSIPDKSDPTFSNDIFILVHPIVAIKGNLPEDLWIPDRREHVLEPDAELNHVVESHGLGIFFMKFKKDHSGLELTFPYLSFLGILPPALKVSHNGSIEHQIIKMILVSLSDRWLRRPNTWWLRTEHDDEIAKPLLPYLSVSDEYEFQNIITCIAANDHIDGVKLVLKEANKHPDSIIEALQSVRDCRDTKAIPLLNFALHSNNYWVREAAMESLTIIGDKTSLPDLLHVIKTQNQNEDISGISFYAYRTIYRIVPDLGEPDDWIYFDKHIKDEPQMILEKLKALKLVDSKGKFITTNTSSRKPIH